MTLSVSKSNIINSDFYLHYYFHFSGYPAIYLTFRSLLSVSIKYLNSKYGFRVVIKTPLGFVRWTNFTKPIRAKRFENESIN